MTETIIDAKDGLAARTITVQEQYGDTFIVVRDTIKNEKINTNLSFSDGKAKAKLATALLGENATVVTDMPKAQLSGEWVEAGTTSRSVFSNPDDIRRVAKNLLAIAAKITEHNAEQEAAKAAEAEKEAEKEAQRSKRRDEVTQELTGDPYARYSDRFAIVKKAIDRIVDLEEAAQVS